MKNVVVVGGAGVLGKYIVKEFIESGYKVTVFDINDTGPGENDYFREINFCKGNILDINDCKRIIKNADIVVLTAAIIYGMRDYPPEMMYDVNTTGTFNVFQAACESGVKRIIFASSGGVYGFDLKLSPKDKIIPEYLPIDENSSLIASNLYALTKIIGEKTAEFFNMKYGITTISLRIMHTRIPIKINAENNGNNNFNEVEIYRSIDKYQENLRKTGMMLWPIESQRIGKDNNEVWSGHLLAYNDIRDAALSFRLAAESECLEGKNEIFNISNTDDNATRFTTEELIKKYNYENIPLKKELGVREPLYCCDKAKKILGYRSKYNWWDLYGKQLFE